MRTAVTFDFHNTLVRCDEWFDLEVRDLPNHVGAELGLATGPQITDTYRSLRREVIDHGQEIDAVAGVVETWRRNDVSIDENDVAPIVDGLMLALVPQSELLPGARSALQSINDMGTPIGIVSSAVHHKFLEWALEFHDVGHLIDEIVTSALAGFYKSRPEIYEFAFDRLGADPTRSVHVGDSYRFDHLTGASIGLRTVWLNESGEPTRLPGPRPSIEVADMSAAGDAVLQILASLENSEVLSNAD